MKTQKLGSLDFSESGFECSTSSVDRERSDRVSRGSVLAGGAVISAALVTPSLAWAAARSGSATAGHVSVKHVQFMNATLKMAGDLYLPEGFSESGLYAAIVCVHPGGGVKEQTAGLYARQLAEHGFITLAFDASYQGASEGMPRFLDDPMRRVGDIYSAVDYLTTLAYVDAERIGALGICAGSGAAVKAACTERRIKALGTVSAVDVGAASRLGWEGKASETDQIKTLEAVARERTAEAAGAAPVYAPYVPQVGDATAPHDLQEAADYYLTSRGQHPNAPNRMLMTSASYMVSFTGFDRVETLLTQPVLIVAGTEAGSLWHSRELYAKAPGPKELFLVKGATHMDLYDGDGAVTAMSKLAPFFARTLTPTQA